MSKCDFCDELAGGVSNAFARIYGRDPLRRVLYSGSRFSVMPSLGQLVPGHLLIVPPQHITSMADLEPLAIEELEDLCARIRTILQNCYGDCIVFEHGVRKPGAGGCGIDHAHMHAVPVNGRRILSVLLQAFRGHKVDRVTDANRVLSPESSYLYFDGNDGLRYIFDAPYIPSQYMRRVVSDSLGNETWDWHTAGFEPDLIATVHRLSAEFCASVVSGN